MPTQEQLDRNVAEFERQYPESLAERLAWWVRVLGVDRILLVGGKPLVLSSMHFRGDTQELSRGANRLIAAGGTLVNGR
jgi:hypothetical protein